MDIIADPNYANLISKYLNKDNIFNLLYISKRCLECWLPKYVKQIEFNFEDKKKFLKKFGLIFEL